MYGDEEAGTTSTERNLWTNGAMHQLRLERKEHIIWPIAAEDRERLPAVLALPFLWNLKVEALKARYRIELVKEEAETWLLIIAPLSDAGQTSFSKAYLQLDRTTYLPRRYVVVGPDGKSGKGFRVTQSQIDPADRRGRSLALPDEVLRLDFLDTQEARPTAWLYRLLTRNGSPELLP